MPRVSLRFALRRDTSLCGFLPIEDSLILLDTCRYLLITVFAYPAPPSDCIDSTKCDFQLQRRRPLTVARLPPAQIAHSRPRLPYLIALFWELLRLLLSYQRPEKNWGLESAKLAHFAVAHLSIMFFPHRHDKIGFGKDADLLVSIDELGRVSCS